MTWYRLLILGNDFPLEEDGVPVLMGWYTTRWVEAADPEEARAVALEALRSEPLLADVSAGCGATISWEEVERVEESDVPDRQGGFSFFRMEHQARTKAKASARP
ncbi:hypothetical protein V5F89_07325 [Pelagerythrobacter marensis]|uniref:DUF4288 domain-containing protein n=1 Tax=Pelagerythrobacter marensis TaxID=543877 RepID=A0ABZ2D057_9SPHN